MHPEYLRLELKQRSQAESRLRRLEEADRFGYQPGTGVPETALYLAVGPRGGRGKILLLRYGESFPGVGTKVRYVLEEKEDG